MTNLTPEEANEVLSKWDNLAQELKAVKKKELELRNLLFAHFFEAPKEGTNTIELGNGWKLKAAYKFTRTLDKASLLSALQQMPEGSEDKLVDYKPSLKLAEYRKLPEDLVKLFDEAVITKPGAPALEIVAPKAK